MATSGIKTAFGGAMITSERAFASEESCKELMQVLKQYNCNIIDSAQVYGDSEELIGKNDFATHGFVIDTKAIGGWKLGSSTRKDILAGAQASMKRLGIPKCDIFYMHAPDSGVPIEETCAGINDAYKEGLFERFGLSNYPASEVEAVYDVCKKNGYVLPTVYQGNYSPVARKQEKILFPTLRKLGIAFYAYSPIAGGFLAKSKQDILDKKGRFDPDTPIGKMYSTLYNKPSLLEALNEWDLIAKEAGCAKAVLAYRWVTYNSPLKKEHGDAIIIGASSMGQLKETLEGLQAGPLSAEVAKKIDLVWTSIEHEAGVDNFQALSS